MWTVQQPMNHGVQSLTRTLLEVTVSISLSTHSEIGGGDGSPIPICPYLGFAVSGVGERLEVDNLGDLSVRKEDKNNCY